MWLSWVTSNNWGHCRAGCCSLAVTPVNIMAGFRKCGIYLVNCGEINDRALAPSTAWHRPTRFNQIKLLAGTRSCLKKVPRGLSTMSRRRSKFFIWFESTPMLLNGTLIIKQPTWWHSCPSQGQITRKTKKVATTRVCLITDDDVVEDMKKKKEEKQKQPLKRKSQKKTTSAVSRRMTRSQKKSQLGAGGMSSGTHSGRGEWGCVQSVALFME